MGESSLGRKEWRGGRGEERQEDLLGQGEGDGRDVTASQTRLA
jgi:hypothetical protein